MEWINIKDRMPPEDTWILAVNSERVEMGVWLGERNGFALPHLSYFNLEITYWMPLPEPPKNS